MKRAVNRSGYLYKVSNNKVFPASSSVKGQYWLQIKLNGRRKRIALKDDTGQPITKFEEARRAQERLMTPLKLKEEQDVLYFLMNALKTAHKPNLANNDVLLTEAANRFANIRQSQGLSKYYAERNVYNARNLIAYVQKDPNKKYVSEITTTEVREFLGRYSKSSARTFNDVLTSLSMFFTETMEDYRGDWSNPCTRIKPKSLNYANQNPKRVLTDEEVKRCLETAKQTSDELYLLFLIGASTGLRLSDCCSLRWSEIDLNAKVIVKVAQKTRKYAVKPVVVGVPEELYGVLSSIKDADKTEYVLPNYKCYEERCPRDRIHYRITQTFRKAGIQTETTSSDGRTVKAVGFHSFRHTFITKHLLEFGTPLAVLQESVGHSSAGMTMHYLQVAKAKAAEASKNYKLY